MRIIQTNHQCAKFLNNTINAPKIPSLGLKFLFPIHKFQTWKPDQKVLSTDMRDSKSWTEILIFQSPPVWTNEKLQRIFFFFFTHKDLFAIKKIPIHKIYHKIYCLR